MSGNLIAEIVEVPRSPNAGSDVATLASEIQRPTSVANSATFLNTNHPRYLDPRLDQFPTDTLKAQTINKVDLIDDDVDPSPFPFKPNQLASLVERKSLDGLMTLGGTSGVIEGLQTSTKYGIVTKLAPVEENGGPAVEDQRRLRERQLQEKHESDEELPAIRLTAPTPTESKADHEASYVDVEERRRVYGRNVVPVRRSKPLLLLIWLALQDKILILLFTVALVSVVIGAFLSPKDTYNAHWVEGLSILVGIPIIVSIPALNDWNRERQLQFLRERKNERTTRVIRDSVEQVIDVKDLVVGDIGILEPGEILPCDGIFLSGHNVKCDEYWFSGGSDAMRKRPFAEVVTTPTCEKDDASIGAPHSHADCFILSGSKVSEGAGKYIVVAVGRRSLAGRVQTSLNSSGTVTPLQDKLNGFATLVAKIGSCVGIVLFIALLFRLLVQFGKDVPQRQPLEKGFAIVSVLIVATVLVVVAVPQGLPLAAILSISFAAKRMFRERILVRTVHASEFLGGVSVICSNKSTFVNEDRMMVVSGTIGIHAEFSHDPEEGHTMDHTPHSGAQHYLGPHHFSLKQDQLAGFLPQELKKALTESLVVNSNAFENTTRSTDGEAIFEGNKIDVALLKFARQSLGMVASDVVGMRDRAKVVRMFPFSNERKCMAVVVTRPDGRYRAYFKGASEIVAKVSTKYVIVRENMRPTSTLQTRVLDDLAREKVTRTIINYANKGLCTLALCYRDFSSWPPLGQGLDNDGEVPFDGLFHDLTLLSVIGIEEPLCQDVQENVNRCHRAGISVKMCTGDNVLTARSVATRCGIFTPGGIIMEGPTFRQLTTAELVEIVPRLQVLARSSAEDKDLLIRALRMLDETVSATGKNANDGPILKTAHVGFSMGISGTEVAKEASDIVLMDDNFSGIIQAVLWGRNVHDAVRKFLQMMVTVNVSAGLLVFLTAIASNTGRSVPSPIQLLWINVIMDTFAALALVTDPKTEKLLAHKPSTVQAPLFTTPMLKTILVQVVYQVVILLILHFFGRKGLDLPPTEEGTRTIYTLVFNTFVFCQILSTFNCRSLEKRLNIFEGVAQNMYFMAMILLEIIIQISVVLYGGRLLGVARLGWKEWCISIGLALLTLPLGVLTLYLPNKPFHSFFRVVGLIKDPDILPTSRHDWNKALSDTRAGLRTFSKLRGGRLRVSGGVVPGADRQYSQIGFPRAARLRRQDVRHLVRSPPSLSAT